MAFTAITPTQVAVGAPLNNALMDLIRTNFDHFNGYINQSVTTTASPTFAGLTSTGNINIAGNCTFGAQDGAGRDYVFNTASLSGSYFSGLLVNGTYAAQTSTVNIKARGVLSGGGYGSELAFYTTVDATEYSRMVLEKTGRLLFKSQGVAANDDGGTSIFVEGYNATDGSIRPTFQHNWKAAGAAYYGSRSIGSGAAAAHSWGYVSGGSATELMNLSNTGSLGVGNSASFAQSYLDIYGFTQIRTSNATDTGTQRFLYSSNVGTGSGNTGAQSGACAVSMSINAAAAKTWEIGTSVNNGAITRRAYMDCSNGYTNFLGTLQATNVVCGALSGGGDKAVWADNSGSLKVASDARLKREVLNYKLPQLSDILNLEGKAYQWKEEIEKQGDAAYISIGFFAQQVKDHIPEAAPLLNDGTYGFYDRAIIVGLVNSIKTLNARIEKLEGAAL